MNCDDCLYTDIMEWEKDGDTERLKPVLWCERYNKSCSDVADCKYKVESEVKEAVEMCKVDILELEALQDGIITRKKLRDLYDEFDRKTWSESEDVRGDNMIEIGTARQILCDLFCELGVWDEGEDPEI